MDPNERNDGGDRIGFHAALPARMRPEIEELFFFHPRQPRLQAGIHAAVARAGMPAITERNGKVWIAVPSGETQCLFACDEGIEPSRAIGIVLYSRPAADTIWITHLAVAADYAHGGDHAALQVAPRLVDRIMTVARSIKGITRIQLPYRDQCYLRVTRRESARSDRPGR